MKKKFNVAAQVTHIAMEVSDVQASIDFYRKWCGMEVVDHARPGVKEDERSVWLSCPGQEDSFVLVLLPGGDGEPKREGMRHIGFDLQSIEELKELAELAEEEGLVHWPYQEHEFPVGTLFSIKDPDGYIVEFSHGQPLGVRHDASNDNKEAQEPKRKIEP